jgi:hypothetical protein
VITISTVSRASAANAEKGSNQFHQTRENTRIEYLQNLPPGNLLEPNFMSAILFQI